MSATLVRNGDYSPLERALSWQDARDAPSLSSRRSSTSEPTDGYRYVDSSNRQYRNPPVNFSATLLRIDGEMNRKTCHPGSIIEGVVKIKLDSPLAAQCLKLIFKGTERIHSDAIGKTNRKRGEKLFAVQSVLWGSLIPNDQGIKWPIIEAGYHEFPFMCKLPMVNYPPTFRHHLASCEFELLASLDRPGIRPFQTVPIFPRYEPYTVSSPLKNPGLHKEKMCINTATKVLVTILNGNCINLLDTNADTLQVRLEILKEADTACINHIEAFISRQVDVHYGKYHQSDTMVMSHKEQSSFKSNGLRAFFIQIPIPSETNKHNNATILRNFSVLGMTPTLDYSKHIKMHYKLCITAKIKHGLIWNKRQLFSIPLHFGTVAPGERLPSSIVNYKDPEVTADTTFNTKPRFIRVSRQEEQLPAYTDDLSPPIYGTQQLRQMTS